jgi:hypothetical protein
MATIVPLSARWTPALDPAPATATLPDRTGRVPLPLREVWPLLVTVVATGLVMLALIAWCATVG